MGIISLKKLHKLIIYDVLIAKVNLIKSAEPYSKDSFSPLKIELRKTKPIECLPSDLMQ